MPAPFTNRFDAGRRLAESLDRYRHRDDLIVLGLAAEGAPVAYAVAKALQAPLDVILVRKIVPGKAGPPLGAVAFGGLCWLDHEIIGQVGATPSRIDQLVREQLTEIQRQEEALRGRRAKPALAGRCVILVDDWMATGYTMKMAARLVREDGPAEIVAAVPVATSAGVAAVRQDVNDLIALHLQRDPGPLEDWYLDNTPVSDSQVHELLSRRVSELSSRPTTVVHSQIPQRTTP